MRNVRSVVIRYLAPDGIVALQGASDCLDLNVINAFASVPGRVASNQQRKVNAEFPAYGHQYWKPISAPCARFHFFDPALRASYPVGKEFLRDTAPLAPVRDALP